MKLAATVERSRSWMVVALGGGVFLAVLAANGVTFSAESGEAPREVYVTPNFHPASCGWLANWSTERVYCANSYLAHLDRVRDDPSYAFVLSEVNNVIAMLEFHPERLEELKRRIREGRVELVNAFFLEPTINLSGGEALVKMGVEGLRWQQQVFGVRPRVAWTIDVTGVHEQMAQIVKGLALDGMVYTRDNPTGKTIHWFEAPDGAKCLALSPGSYADWREVFSCTAPMNDDAIGRLLEDVRKKAERTPLGAPVLVLAGSGDYSLPPACSEYPQRLLEDWRRLNPQVTLRFSTLSGYLDAVLPLIRSGRMELSTSRSGAKLTWTSFWIQNPRVKTAYRRCEHALQSAEAAATLASLHGKLPYPTTPLHHAWLLMLLNMDRNTLWGAAGGMVFEDPDSWDARDRFEKVEAIVGEAGDAALRELLGRGPRLGLFNPLNWRRTDPLLLPLPAGSSIAGCVCQKTGDGQILCRPQLPSVGAVSLQLADEPPAEPAVGPLPPVIETAHYWAKIDSKTGVLASLKLKPSGREVLAGPMLLVAEQAGDFHNTPERSKRRRLADSKQFAASVTAAVGPLAAEIRSQSKFYGGGACRQIIRFYKDHPRIDFDTELNDIPNKTVVAVELPLAEPIRQKRRAIPYGFSHGACAASEPDLPGRTEGIQAAIRWSHYQTEHGGAALLDRGLTGRERSGDTPLLFLLNAQETYMGYPCPWLSGRGRHRFSYALVGHEGDWESVRIPQLAWEFNTTPLFLAGAKETPPHEWVTTSGNVVMEALRREAGEVELRFVECLGRPGTARVAVELPHTEASLTDLVGGRRKPLSAPGPYELEVRPQEIVTLRLKAPAAVPAIAPLMKWDELVPPRKRAALKKYLPGLIGHPPRGDRG